MKRTFLGKSAGVSVLLALFLIGNANPFIKGYCTWYAADRFSPNVTDPQKWWSGDAGAWIENAKGKGWKTTDDVKAAVAGALIVWQKGKYGHVAFVESVSTNGISIAEMNWGDTTLGNSSLYGKTETREQLKHRIDEAITDNFGKATSSTLTWAQALNRGKKTVFAFSGYILPTVTALPGAGAPPPTPIPTPPKNPPTNAATNSISCLIIDRSSSMEKMEPDGKTRMQAAKEAGLAWLKVLRAEGQTFGEKPFADLVSFSDVADTIPKPTDDYDSVDKSIQAIFSNGGTNITSALDIAIQRLSEDPYKSWSKSIVLVSDGSHNASGMRPTDAALLDRAKAAGIKIFTIGCGSKSAAEYDEVSLRKIAGETAGSFYLAEDAHELGSVLLSARHQAIGSPVFASHGVVAKNGFEDLGSFDPSKPKMPVTASYGLAYAQVSTGAASLLCTLNYDFGRLDLQIKDPMGQLVTPAYPGATLVSGNPTVLVVKDPKPGSWSAGFDANGVPSQGTRYGLEISGRASPYGFVGGGGGGSPSNLSPAVAVMSLLVLVLVARLGFQRRNQVAPLKTRAGLIVAVDGKAHPVAKQAILGSSPQCDITLTDPQVSKKHALLYRQGDDWYLRDLDSRNGVYHNGKKVAMTPLRAGDIILLGTKKLTINLP